MPFTIDSTSSLQSISLIRIFLQNQRSGVLATATNKGVPYAAPIYYMCEDDFRILFATKRETQKFKHLEENKKVAFVVYDEPTKTSVQITGTIEFIEEKQIQEKVYDNLYEALMEQVEESEESTSLSEKLSETNLMFARLQPLVIKLAEYVFLTPSKDDLFETIHFSQ